MKKIVSVIVMAAVMFTLSTGAFAAGTVTLSQAYAKALKSAGVTSSQVTAVEKDSDDGVYEIEFTKKSNGAEYSFEYSRYGVLLEKSVDFNRVKNTGAKSLSKSQARTKVISFGDFRRSTVESGSCTLKKDDGQWIYKVRFSTSSYYFEYEVHASTGKILEWDKTYRR